MIPRPSAHVGPIRRLEGNVLAGRLVAVAIVDMSRNRFPRDREGRVRRTTPERRGSISRDGKEVCVGVVEQILVEALEYYIHGE